MPRLRSKHKYGAIPTMVDGIKFASKREAARYRELKLLERAGEIRSIQCQPKFPLYVQPVIAEDPVKVGCYIADFVYEKFKFPGTSKECETIVEDVKGFKTPIYRLKKRMVEALYQIEIKEV